MSQPRYRFGEADRILTEAAGGIPEGLSLLLSQNGEVIYNRSFGPLDASQPVAIVSAGTSLPAGTPTAP